MSKANIEMTPSFHYSKSFVQTINVSYSFKRNNNLLHLRLASLHCFDGVMHFKQGIGARRSLIRVLEAHYS